jgi:hypothetical protein
MKSNEGMELGTKRSIALDEIQRNVGIGAQKVDFIGFHPMELGFMPLERESHWNSSNET